MNRLALIVLTTCALLAPIRAAWPQTTPPGVDPEVPPGTETPQVDILLQGEAPQPLIPEIQPGTETPGAGDTEMGLGTGPLPGTHNSGDEDEFEDLDIERLTIQGGGILPDAPGANPAPASPGIPEQPVSGSLDLPAIGMKPKDAGGGEPQPAAKTPRFKAGKALRDSVNLMGEPTRRENCGTVLTGLIDDPDSDVNPCPTGCERGEQLWVKTYKSGDTTQYEASYQCYMPAIPTLAMPADAPSSGENCGTYWTGWMDTLDAGVNPCPQNCVRGQNPTVKTGLSDHGIKYDVNYQCYTATMAADARAPKPVTDAAAAPQSVSSTPTGKLIPASGPWGAFVRVEGAHFGSAETVRGMWFPADGATQPPSMSQTVTLRAHDGADAIEIQIPADPLSSGRSGDFTNGSLRLLLTMPDESVVYAGQYTIDSGKASTTPPVAQTGTASGRVITPEPVAVVTPSLQMTGKRLSTIGALSGRELAPEPVAVVTPSLQMTGKRLSTIGALSGRELAPEPIVVVTPALQMTGKRLKAIPDRPTKVINPTPK